MTNTTRSLLAALALLFAASAGSAQSASSAAERYMEAMRASNWSAAAAMMHPGALAEFRRLVQVVAARPDAAQVMQPAFGVATGEIAGLSDLQLYERVIARQLSADPEVAEIMRRSRFRITGETAAGDTAKVAYEMTAEVGGSPVTIPSEIRFLRDAGAWKALLSVDMERALSSMTLVPPTQR
jgi:hypothetical protein